MEANLQDTFNSLLQGRVSVFRVPAEVEYKDVLAHYGTPLFSGNNVVVENSKTILQNLLRGKIQDYLPSFISIGDGGDSTQAAGIDTGTRVAPDVADATMRSTVARIPIIQTIYVDSDTWEYVAVARPNEALASIINEFGVEAANGSLLAHFVTDPDATTGRATRYIKTSLEYLVIRWQFTLRTSTLPEGATTAVDL